jgi:hypothetical protein
MADFTKSLKYGTAVYPVHAQETSGLVKRCEPLLTPEKLVSRFLKGIPLTFPNGDVLTPEDLTDKIMLAVNEAELLLNMTINREQFRQKVPMDHSLYHAFVHIRAEHGPIISLERLAITDTRGINVFEIPAEWIESANFAKRLINVIPLLAAYGVNSLQGTTGTGAGLAFLTAMGGMGWVPAYWEITYTAGMSAKEGQVPVVVNELIGVLAAIEALSLIAPTNIWTSQSLSQDGISQSSSGPGPAVYRQRLEELELKKKDIIKKLKGVFMGKFFIDNI